MTFNLGNCEVLHFGRSNGACGSFREGAEIYQDPAGLKSITDQERLSELGFFLFGAKVHSVSQALEEHRREDRVRPKVQRAQPHGAASSDSGLAVDEEDPSRSQVTEGTSVAAWEGPSEPGTVSQSTAPTPTPDPPSVSAGGGEKEKGAVSSSKRNGSREFQRVTRMCFAMFLIYVACYFPFCIMHVADGKKRAPILLHMIAGNCTWLNSCLNPLLYAVMNRQFQTAYLGVLRRAAGLFTRCFCSGRSPLLHPLPSLILSIMSTSLPPFPAPASSPI
ncbi:G-protein coupled receptor 84-like [Hypanus sabinus]|uniref:G-protein coupled receptor 84-like n=1 Tax=Hypanus sabinus TaxID=79690 RepID=UPI0028C49EF9|nr:G-protein coupled receptor 84-like [Hypanus sabinus]